VQFYSGDIFPHDPQFVRDVAPIVDLLKKIRPAVVTLALDPEGSGPDTHYKCLMALRCAIDRYVTDNNVTDLQVWGYRNVWSRFHLTEATAIVPVSLNSFAVLHNMFSTCFVSQKSASFPSFELDGTFSELAQKVWVDQFTDLCTVLGKSFFHDDPHPLKRRAFGALYLKQMAVAEFMEETKGIDSLEESKRCLPQV
jgi:glucosamine-6-phosphate deaminase